MSSSGRNKAAVCEQDRASLVCLTCRAGKRQCDKRLPICSRCKKLDRPCEYPAAVQLRPAARTFPSRPPLARVRPNACIRCKEHKRRCDRIFPRCSRCLRLGIDCAYAASNPESPTIVPADREDTYGVHPNVHAAPLAQTEVRVAFEPPIGYRTYMSHLMQFCASCHKPLI
ncbi:hypothetical protein BJX99DRAFT_237257 [Aspergillus californicus]